MQFMDPAKVKAEGTHITPLDKPIIFSGAMIRALLDDRKKQTRRLAWRIDEDQFDEASGTMQRAPSPWQKVKPGDRLWVRENFRVQQINRYTSAGGAFRSICIDYPAGEGRQFDDFRRWVNVADDERLPRVFKARKGESGKDAPLVPSIHMPRAASRLTLIVTATKIEKLQDISEEDATAEGAPLEIAGNDAKGVILTRRTGFVRLWGSLHGTDSWLSNPEVVALTFTVEKRNIDA